MNKKRRSADATAIQAPKYAMAQAGLPAGTYERTTKPLEENIGQESGYKMKVLVLQGKESAFAKPTLPKDPTETDKMAWGKDYDLYHKNNERYKMNEAKVFAKICGHCTKPMKVWLKIMDEYKEADKNQNVAALLKLIKEVTFDASNKKFHHGKQLKRGDSWSRQANSTTKAFWLITKDL